MKFTVYVVALSFFAISAYPAEFETKLTYCNSIPGDASTCSALSSWQEVSLKDLKSVILPVESDDVLVQLEDEFGNIWAQPLYECKSKPSDLRGCFSDVDLTKPEQKSIRISIWDIRRPQRNLALFIDGQNQLSLLTDDGNHLVFSLTGKQSQ